MRLLADCGNSTVKLAGAKGRHLAFQVRVAPEPGELDAAMAPHDADASALFVLPGSRAHALIIEQWWSRAGRGRPIAVIGRDTPAPDLGQYKTCGLDRVLAGFGALSIESRPALVVDAGTATTLTAWSVDPARVARFEGGLILPGAHACLLGLSMAAPALPKVEPSAPDASARQHSTTGAISAAVGIGYPGMVAACLVRLAEESGIARVLLTGGNGTAALKDALARALGEDVETRPELVLEGLAAYLDGG